LGGILADRAGLFFEASRIREIDCKSGRGMFGDVKILNLLKM
jgi:hypothetical protein